MTSQIRQTANMPIYGKCGAPGAIRTPDPQIRRLRPAQEFIYIFRRLLSIVYFKPFEGFRGFYEVFLKVCHNHAIMGMAS